MAGVAQGDLARELDIDVARLSRLESGRSFATEIELRQLEARLGVLREFFLRPVEYEHDEEGTHFRSKHSARQRARRRALAQATLLDELIGLIGQRLSLPDLQLPDCGGMNPEDAAYECRSAWGISMRGALEDVQREAELSGVFVVNGSPSLMKDVDAYSAHASSGGAIMVLNPRDPPSRNAFNVAHELGHLVLHRGIETGDRETERDADRFAAALLMPAEGFSKSWRAGPGWPDSAWLVQMKSWWRVSMQAMVRRAQGLGLIDHTTYTRFWKGVNRHGWRTNEPAEFEWGPPRLLRDSVTALEHHFGTTPSMLAVHLGVKIPMLEEICGFDMRPEPVAVAPASSHASVVNLQDFWDDTSA